MDDEKMRKYVDAGLCNNFTDTADEIGHSTDLVHSYKKKLKEMGKVERNVIIAQAALENVKEASSDFSDEKELEEVLKNGAF